MTTGQNQSDQSLCVVGNTRLTIEDVVAIAVRHTGVRLSDDTCFNRRIDAGAEYLERLLADGGTIYGVTTGYGDSCTVAFRPNWSPNCRCT
jgi:histidine ammonia-lyase